MAIPVNCFFCNNRDLKCAWHYESCRSDSPLTQGKIGPGKIFSSQKKPAEKAREMLRHPYVTGATSQGSKGFVGEIIEASRHTWSGQGEEPLN